MQTYASPLILAKLQPASAELTVDAQAQNQEGMTLLIDGNSNVNAAGIQLKLEWNSRSDPGEEAARGIYFYKIKTCEFSQSKKMVILK